MEDIHTAASWDLAHVSHNLSLLDAATRVSVELPARLQGLACGGSVNVGAFSYFVSGYIQDAVVGRYCSFGHDIQVGRGPHPLHFASTSPFSYSALWWELFFESDDPRRLGVESEMATYHPVTTTHIGHDVWVGMGAFIAPGVSLGTGSAVAACSVVTRDVPPYAIVGGNPARIIRMRFEPQTIARLLESKWWEFAPWQLRMVDFASPDAAIDTVTQLRVSGIDPFEQDPVQIK